MTLLAEKLKDAGADTLGAEFTARLTECVRRYPDSVIDAWRHLGETWGFAKARQIMKDMRGKEQKSPPLSSGQSSTASHSDLGDKVQPYKPRDKSRERKERIEKVVLMFGYKMLDGRDLADVGAHELDHYVRFASQTAADGALCAELQKELPQLTGNMRFANLRELLTVEQVAAARKRAGV